MGGAEGGGQSAPPSPWQVGHRQHTTRLDSVRRTQEVGVCQIARICMVRNFSFLWVMTLAVEVAYYEGQGRIAKHFFPRFCTLFQFSSANSFATREADLFLWSILLSPKFLTRNLSYLAMGPPRECVQTFWRVLKPRLEWVEMDLPSSVGWIISGWAF